MNMKREIVYNDTAIQYELIQKNVKNINLIVMPDGVVKVSANRCVSVGEVDRFVLSVGGRIVKAKEKIASAANTPRVQYRTQSELNSMISEMCREVYPHFQVRGIEYPDIKFKRMISRWGSCNPARGIVTFSTELMYAPKEFVQYVVMHEFTHFLQANHSKKFYYELEKICPDWKERKRAIKKHKE